MSTRLLILLSLAACTDATDTDLDLAAGETVQVGKDDGNAGWDLAPTLHAGARAFDAAAAGGRRIHPLWIAGTPASPVALDLEVRAADGDDVRVAVLGPLRDGARAVLAADGYASRTQVARVQVASELAGEHLVVIGSYGLARATSYDVIARCTSDGCAARVDVLAAPKAGALVATGTGLVEARLGAVLADRAFDVELELWASPPGRPWDAIPVAAAVASGDQVNALVPASVAAGDDLTLVVREAGGRVLDTGVRTRFAPEAVAFARTDAILYGDLVSLQIGGVAGFFEGIAELAIRSETRDVEIARAVVRAELPGAAGIGYGAFDATFAPALFDAQGGVNPDLPHDGERLSVGTIDGDGGYRRLGCFEYCNDLAGTGTCTGGARACE